MLSLEDSMITKKTGFKIGLANGGGGGGNDDDGGDIEVR